MKGTIIYITNSNNNNNNNHHHHNNNNNNNKNVAQNLPHDKFIAFQNLSINKELIIQESDKRN